MDPFSALGVASSIVQLVDFGVRLVSNSTELQKSKDGILVKHRDLALIAQDLYELSEGLTAGNIHQISSLPTDEAALSRLAIKCNELTQEIIADLRRLSLRNPHAKWDSVYVALKTIRGKSRMQETRERLDEYRSELTIRLLSILGKNQSATVTVLRDLSREHSYYRIKSENRLEILKEEILDALARVHHNIEIANHSADEAIQSEKSLRYTEPLLAATIEGDEHPLILGETVSKNLSTLLKDKQRLASEGHVLGSLYFEHIERRVAHITVAHHKSFDWLLSKQSPKRRFNPQYLEWLTQHDGIYWIAGKPGSGKSTLMKYLCNNKNVVQALQEWAGQKQLICASYFFWNAGSELQKSQEGLLRSLLYEILRSCPELMPKVTPSRWHQDRVIQGTPASWSQEELLSVFSFLGQQQITGTRFCFFIDGLDEYAGPHADIVDTLLDLSKSSAIKICLSSRPYNIFVDAYGQSPGKMLTLQDFNAADMDAYIKDTLEKDVRFVRLKDQDLRYQDLVDEIREKAQGVFLWVVLVIRSLRQGLINVDSLRFLQERVRAFPADLEQFYAQILQNIEPIYHDQMAKSLKIALTISEPSPVLTYSYLDEEHDDFGIKIPVQRYFVGEVSDRCTSMALRLNARCADFLEVFYDKPNNPVCTYKVDFLHRTARDFFLDPKMQALLDTRLRKPFNVEKYLCSAFLAQAKLAISMLIYFRTTQQFNPQNELVTFLRYLVTKILDCAGRIEKDLGIPEDAILDELDATVLHQKLLDDPIEAEFDYFDYKKAMDLNRPGRRGYILGQAIRKGLLLYVSKTIERDSHFRLSVYGRSPFHYVLTNMSTTLDIETVKVLLGRGISPNQPYDTGSESTPWIELLRWLQLTAGDMSNEDISNEVKANWTNAVAAMIMAGAEPNPSLVKDGTAFQLITELCLPNEAGWLKAQLQCNGKEGVSQPPANCFPSLAVVSQHNGKRATPQPVESRAQSRGSRFSILSNRRRSRA